MNWPEVAIGEIFDVARGGSPRPIDKFITDDPDGLNWVMIGDATSSGKVIESTKKRIRPEGLKKTRAVKPGDFILSNSMSFGRPYIMGIEGCIHDGWLLLRPRGGNVDPDYFYHLLGSQTVYAKFASRAAGATVKNLNSDIVRNVSIPLPPLEEQRRIAGILDEADALRRLRARALEKLNTLGQSIFHEMFGDYPDELPLSELTTKITDGTHQAPEWADNGVPFIFVSNVRGQKISLETNKFVTEDEHERLLKRTDLSSGDVIYTCVGSYGNSAVVGDDTNFVFQRHIAHLKPKPNCLDPVFLSYGLEAPNVRYQADRTATGIAQKTVTLKALKAISFPAPTLAEQQKFAHRVKDVTEAAEHAELALNQTKALFASLQHRAFQGDL